MDFKISNSQLSKLGQALRNDVETEDDLMLLSQFRSSHRYLLEQLTRNLKDRLPKPLFMARRLKRLPSIKHKLKRFEGMSLARMQDIGGVRAVFKTSDEVMEFAENLRKIYSSRRTKFSIEREYNYIAEPKKDGYRSYHVVFKYNGRKDDLKGRTIELQLRDLLQHYWATAVETFDLLNKGNIKLGGGDAVHRRFFWLCAELLAGNDQYKTEIVGINNKYKILRLLSGVRVGANHLDQKAKTRNKDYLLLLDFKINRLQVIPFDRDRLSTADTLYINNENSRDLQVVLVNLDDVKKLKEAYPNYYLDANKFIEEIEHRLR